MGLSSNERLFKGAFAVGFGGSSLDYEIKEVFRSIAADLAKELFVNQKSQHLQSRLLLEDEPMRNRPWSERCRLL